MRLDGELSELEEAHLDAHLDACADCSAYALEVGRVISLLRAEPLETPPAWGLAVYRRRPRSRLSVAAAAATLAVAAASSFLAGHLVALRGHSSYHAATGTGTIFVARPPGGSLAAVIDGGLSQRGIARPAMGRAIAI